jgi:hypothetical protein
MNRLRIALRLGVLNDAQLELLATSIGTLGPQSSLINVAGIATSVAAVTTKAAAFKVAGEAVQTGADQLRNAKDTRALARMALENEVSSLAGQVTNNAKVPGDVTGLAFQLRDDVVISTVTVLDPPGSIAVTMPKSVRGHFKAAAQDVGNEQWHYAAEWSPDPVGASTWVVLPGTGRSRRVSGASGTKVWVRFARVRGQMQSDWCNPVLVTIP